MKFLLSIFVCTLFFAAPQFGQSVTNEHENTLKVKGTAVLKQIPEILSARITIKVSADKYNPCQEKLVNAIDQAKKILLQNGIANKIIQLGEMNISERKDYLPDGQVKTSFEGNSSLVIEKTYSAEYAGSLLAALHNESVPMLYNLNFSLSENQKKELRQKAIRDAVADAREKAEAIAAASNIRLLKIRSIQYSDDETGGVFEGDLVQENVLLARNQVFIKGGGQMPQIDFNPGEIGIRKSVSIEWWMEADK